jgi:hypothetical protein
MISISSTNPEFSVNFPSPVPVKEIALAKLRVYHSWPNIRSKTFGDQQPNNSLVFAHKNKDDGTPDWQVVSIPTGSYEIEQIDAEFQRRIKSITGKESKIAIKVHQPTLSSTIEISTEGYAVDIYRSSIRTVLGWPEKLQLREFVNIPKPVKSDYITDVIAPDNPIKSYDISEHPLFNRRFLILTFSSTGRMEGNELKGYYTVNEDETSNIFTAMNNDFSLLLVSLKSGALTRDEFISVVTKCNKIIDDMEDFNLRIIQRILNDDYPQSRIELAKEYNILVKDIPTFKLPGYNVPELKKRLTDAIDEGFKIIYDTWKKLTRSQTTILTHNNSPDDDGRHIAPHNVNISSVLALNLICSAIEGSYQINLDRSDQAQQASILYSFAPSVSPGYLIIEDPTNPVYMRCHNNLLTRINFRLTDQSNNLIDLRGEVLAISLFVKS